MKNWPKSKAACQPTAHQSEPVTRTLTQRSTPRANIIPMSIAFSCGLDKCAPANNAVVINVAGQKPAPRQSDCKAYPRKTYSSVTRSEERRVGKDRYDGGRQVGRWT